MKTYISEESHIYVQWAWLTIGIPLYALLTLFALRDYMVFHRTVSLVALFMMPLISFLFSYNIFKTHVLLLDKNKIVLKILWNELTYDIHDYDGISDSYKIKFADGKVFRVIIPKERNWYFDYAFSKEEKIPYYDDLIREIIQTHSANERDGIENH